MNTLEIDGSFGEGGGQILRTALSLSCIKGLSFRLFNIRKGRRKPGLMPQHLTCIEAVTEVCRARVSGNQKNSTELTFHPGKINAGTYVFDIKTAGSISLVLQTLLPLLIHTDSPSQITIKGGTHVPFSPTYHYLSNVFIPVLSRIGIKAESSINTYGFYPKGGGETTFSISPAKNICSINMHTKGELVSLSGYSGVSRLPKSIAERQKNAIMGNLPFLTADVQVLDVSSPGEGTFVFLKGEYKHTLTGFSSLGKRGKPAETVGKEAAEEFLAFHKSQGCLDPHLSDQIVMYLCLSQEDSSFTTSRITQHLLTNLWVIEKFLNIQYEIEGDIHSEGKIQLKPASARNY
jgi:RNA 3'-terminal phosphate cyclase (ATP)